MTRPLDIDNGYGMKKIKLKYHNMCRICGNNFWTKYPFKIKHLRCIIFNEIKKIFNKEKQNDNDRNNKKRIRNDKEFGKSS